MLPGRGLVCTLNVRFGRGCRRNTKHLTERIRLVAQDDTRQRRRNAAEEHRDKRDPSDST
jgi:hypothetical protein